MNNNNDIESINKINKKIIDIPAIISTIKNKHAAIFCRVSSFGQTGAFHISFEVQEHKGTVKPEVGSSSLLLNICYNIILTFFTWALIMCIVIST